jgi:hypothetical protein
VQKKQYADRKKYATQTGGGPPTKKLSNETEKIVDMMKDWSSFVGLQGCESSINLTEGAYIIIDISNILKRPADFVYTVVTNSDLYISSNKCWGPKRLNIRMHIFTPC